jgi:predicted HNH restriction endonuclease
VRAAKELWRITDPLLRCDVCDFSFTEKYGELGQNYIEAHHTTPVSKLRAGERTKVKDLAKVCANCHRMLHIGTDCLSIAELRERLKR